VYLALSQFFHAHVCINCMRCRMPGCLTVNSSYIVEIYAVSELLATPGHQTLCALEIPAITSIHLSIHTSSTYLCSASSPALPKLGMEFVSYCPRKVGSFSISLRFFACLSIFRRDVWCVGLTTLQHFPVKICEPWM